MLFAKGFLIPLDSNKNEYNRPQLRRIASTHRAFSERSSLEILAEKYKIIIKLVPKFHCELNPIEGLWCFLKMFVRKRTDQTFSMMKELIFEAYKYFKDKHVNMKLWRRVWQALNMYQDPALSYKDVITLLYGARRAEKKNHREIYNTHLD